MPARVSTKRAREAERTEGPRPKRPRAEATHRFRLAAAFLEFARRFRGDGGGAPPPERVPVPTECPGELFPSDPIHRVARFVPGLFALNEDGEVEWSEIGARAERLLAPEGRLVEGGAGPAHVVASVPGGARAWRVYADGRVHEVEAGGVEDDGDGAAPIVLRAFDRSAYAAASIVELDQERSFDAEVEFELRARDEWPEAIDGGAGPPAARRADPSGRIAKDYANALLSRVADGRALVWLPVPDHLPRSAGPDGEEVGRRHAIRRLQDADPDTPLNHAPWRGLSLASTRAILLHFLDAARIILFDVLESPPTRDEMLSWVGKLDRALEASGAAEGGGGGRDRSERADPSLLDSIRRFLWANRERNIIGSNGEPVVDIEFTGNRFGVGAPAPVPIRLLDEVGMWEVIGRVRDGEEDVATLNAALAERVRQLDAWERFLLENPTYVPPYHVCDYENCLELRARIETYIRPLLKGDAGATCLLKGCVAMYECGIPWSVNKTASGPEMLNSFVKSMCDRNGIVLRARGAHLQSSDVPPAPGQKTRPTIDPKAAEFMRFDPERCMYYTYAKGTSALVSNLLSDDSILPSGCKAHDLVKSCLANNPQIKAVSNDTLLASFTAEPLVPNGYSFRNAVLVYEERGLVYHVRPGADPAEIEELRANAGPHVRFAELPERPEERLGIVCTNHHDVPALARGRWEIENPQGKDFEDVGISWEGEPTLLHRILADQCLSVWQQFVAMALIGRAIGWRRDAMKTFVTLVGESNTGKSVFALSIDRIMGSAHVANLEAKGAGSFSFETAIDAATIVFLEGAGLANGDIDRNTFLKLTAQEPVTVNVKHKKPVQLMGHLLAKTVITCSNEKINFTEKSNEFSNRTFLLRFLIAIDPNKRDGALLDKISASAGEIVHACATAYYALLELLRGRVPADLYPESYLLNRKEAMPPMRREELLDYARQHVTSFPSYADHSGAKILSMFVGGTFAPIRKRANWTPEGDAKRKQVGYPKMPVVTYLSKFASWLTATLKANGDPKPIDRASAAMTQLEDILCNSGTAVMAELGLVVDKEAVPFDRLPESIQNDLRLQRKGPSDKAPQKTKFIPILYGIVDRDCR